MSETIRKLGLSRFAQRVLDARPALAAELADPAPFTRAEMQSALGARKDDNPDDKRALRELRNRVLLRVMARDLSGRAGLDEVCATMIYRDLNATRRPLEFAIGKGGQDILNPRGVNVIRDFRADRRSIRVWGARTMSSDPLWRYINVRRLFLFVEESIDEGTQWVVFEPNDETNWARVRQVVSSFLTTVWRFGALQGATEEQALFVR
jgi:hypothetical protein